MFASVHAINGFIIKCLWLAPGLMRKRITNDAQFPNETALGDFNTCQASIKGLNLCQ